MNVILSQTHLRRLTRGFGKVVPPHGSPLPVLECVRFRCLDGSNAEAAVTNLDEALTLALPGCASGSGAPDDFLCPLAELRRLAKELGSGDAVLLMPLAGEPPRLEIVVQVAGHDVRSRIETLSPSEFPAITPCAPGLRADVTAFLNGYRTALPFVSEDPGRVTQGGVFWHEEAHAFVATDGRRLSVIGVPDLSLGQDVVIPASKVLGNGTLDGGEGAIGIATADGRTHLHLTCGPWRWQGRSPEGTYPDYRVVIPAETGRFAATVEIAPADLPLARSAVARFAGERNVAVCLGAVPGGVPFVASLVPEPGGSFPQVQLANSRCTADAPHAQAVNGRYLIECLEAGFLNLRLPPDCSPWRCTGDRPGLHVLMPLRDDVGAILAPLAGAANQGEPSMPPETPTAPSAPLAGTATAADSAAADTAAGAGAAVPPAEPAAADGAASLSLVPTDPLQDLRSAVAEAEEALRQAATAVRAMREKVRAVERSIRERERQYARSEKVLGQLKVVAGF